MAKGSLAKESITKKILETFDGSFPYDKEIRIPFIENGEEVQIKVTLTCAKANVTCGADVATPGSFPVPTNTPVTVRSNEPVAPSEEEKQAVADMLRALGL
jgi:hypothetical protein